MRRAHLFVGLAAASTLIGLAPETTPAGAAGPTCRGQEATIVGTPGPDELVGTTGRDVIVARDGDDHIRARRGDDLVCAGGGSDRVDGGPGADHLRGEGDRRDEDAGGWFLRGDVLTGGAGDDLLVGGHDNRDGVRRLRDTVSLADAPSGVVVDLSGRTGIATGRGTDTITIQPAMGVEGSAFADTIRGSQGADHLDGGPGDDRVDGRSGSDTVLGEAVGADSGDDRLIGGTGDDLLGSYAGRDAVRGGPGNDFVEAYSDRPTVVSGEDGDDYVARNLTAGSGSGSAGGDGRDVLVLYGTTLEDLPTRPRVIIDLRSGTTTVATAPAATGTVGGFEEHRLVGDLPWDFHGTPVRDRVWAISGGPLRAWTYAGDDWVRGTPLADAVDGGAGVDEVVRSGGGDTCRGIERGRC